MGVLAFDAMNFAKEVHKVPVPASAALLGLGLLGLSAFRRAKQA